MRFLLDHNVDFNVAHVLRQNGHECWTAGDAGLSAAGDDDLTVYADNRRAVLLTHDRAFSERRRRNVIGRHVWLRCPEWEAATLIEAHLDRLCTALEAFPDDLWIVVSPKGINMSHDWQ